MATQDSPVEFAIPADKHQQVVKVQREFIGAIADRVESGEPVARVAERKLIAGILRAWARQIPEAHEGATKVDPGYVAIHFACLVNGHGRGKGQAMAELAEIYGVPAEAIEGAIAKFETSAMRLVPKRAGTDG